MILGNEVISFFDISSVGQVVDVNRSNKGTRSGGIGRFSTMVVVGNFAVRSSPTPWPLQRNITVSCVCCLQYCNVLLGLSSCAVRLCGSSAGCVGNGRRQVGRAGGLCQEGLCSGTTRLLILSLYSQDFMQGSTLPDMTACVGVAALFLSAGCSCKVLRGET